MPQITLQMVVEIIVEQNGTEEAAKITEATRLVEDLGLDSLDRVELVMALEERFDIQIDDDQFEDLKTVGDVINLLSTIQ